MVLDYLPANMIE